jgi:hypothetical protein
MKDIRTTVFPTIKPVGLAASGDSPSGATAVSRMAARECGVEPSAKLPPALIPTSATPQNPQRNCAGQHFWPNLFLGRWLRRLAFKKFEK